MYGARRGHGEVNMRAYVRVKSRRLKIKNRVRVRDVSEGAWFTLAYVAVSREE